jgi:hypothetical protein
VKSIERGRKSAAGTGCQQRDDGEIRERQRRFQKEDVSAPAKDSKNGLSYRRIYGSNFPVGHTSSPRRVDGREGRVIRSVAVGRYAGPRDATVPEISIDVVGKIRSAPDEGQPQQRAAEEKKPAPRCG